MAMSDCPECWETPCICGHEYKRRSIEYLTELRNVIDKVIKEKQDVIDKEFDEAD